MQGGWCNWTRLVNPHAVFAVCGDQDEIQETTRDVWVTALFLDRCRKQINVTTLYLICCLDFMRMITKLKIHIRWGIYFQSATKRKKRMLSLWFSVELWLQPYSPFIIVKACPVFLSSTRLLTIFAGESACLTQLKRVSWLHKKYVYRSSQWSNPSWGMFPYMQVTTLLSNVSESCLSLVLTPLQPVP